MTFRQLQKISSAHHYPLWLDKYFPKLARSVLRKIFSLVAILAFIFSFDSLPLYFGSADGLFFLFVDLYLVLFFLEAFYRSMKGQGVRTRIRDKLSTGGLEVDYALSSIIFETDEIDVTRALLETAIGQQVLLRAGVAESDCRDFIYGKRSPVLATSLHLEGETINLEEYVVAVYEADRSLQSFLASYGVSKEEFRGAARWVMSLAERSQREDRFWSRENLGSIPSVGKSWSYGEAADLGKYGSSFLSSHDISFLDIENGYREREVSLLENILERQAEANAVIIDDDEGVARDIVGRFLKKIKLGSALPLVEHKNIFELEWNLLVADFKSKTELERELLKILDQSAMAGNIILYVRDLVGFVGSCKGLGVNLPSILEPYLASPVLQIIASVTNTDFHYFIETSPALLQKFERVIPDRVGAEASLPVLFEQVANIEKESSLRFSYPAVWALATSAERFGTYGEMPGKALDLLFEITPYAISKGIQILREKEVMIFVSEKTGVAQGIVKDSELEQIAHLEGLLHQRVVGQEEAINSIASAMRRARSGINNPKRPLASLLFLGPTGVGKTEVTKALAENFFGGESNMIRFDMSEYSGADALNILTGDFASGKSGVLANKVRDAGTGVLLFDEFEKASQEVLDLFLQLLDEGLFTDALGKPVNCRNFIIIATSNAGSTDIWRVAREGRELGAERNNILNKIIESKVFKPELLNRFDGVVLFRPLVNDELLGVAKIGLQKLAGRLKEKDIELIVSDSLVNYLVEKGADPQFGARAINRFIQEKVEDLIARKMLSGEAGPGSVLEIKPSELE
jgi:ATP-dependent Clp protease ATP-binding subunit ClpC